MRPAEAYLRVSSAAQALGMQRTAIERVARARGFRIVAWHEEKASGRKLARPVLDGLRAAVAKGEIRNLFVFRLDRLTRSGIRDTLAVVSELRRAGCTLHTVADGFEVDGPGGELVLAVLAWAAEQERLTIGERVKAARERIEKQGGSWGRPRKMDPGTLTAARKAKKEGKTIREVAIALKVSRSTVQRALAQKGHYAEGGKRAAKKRRKPSAPNRVLLTPGEKAMLEISDDDDNEAPPPGVCPRCGQNEPVFIYQWPGQPESTCCVQCKGELVLHASSIGLALEVRELGQVEDNPEIEPPFKRPAIIERTLGAEPEPGWVPNQDPAEIKGIPPELERGSSSENLEPVPDTVPPPAPDDDEIPFGGDT